MNSTIEYKCPHCGGMLEFDSSTQQMKCPYCDSIVTVEEAAQSGGAGDGRAEVTGSAFGDEGDGFSLYHCSSCGAEIIADETAAAMHCPYCGNPVILTGRVAGELKPELIIPFRVAKDEAKAALKEHFRGRKLLPAVFADENRLDEIKGVYLPFWLYDTVASCDAGYSASNVRTWSDRDYIYTETSNYSVQRSGTLAFNNVPVDALNEVDNSLTESLEIFDTSGAVPFSTAYLSGFFANRYDVSAEDCLARARERIVSSVSDRIDDTVTGYSSVDRQSCSVRLTGTKIKYAFFPAWILRTSWRGENYLFAMNGQSGSFVGNLPIDKKKYRILRLLWGALFSAVIFIIWMLAAGVSPGLAGAALSLAAGFLLGGLPLRSARAELKSVRRKSSAAGYERSGSFSLSRREDIFTGKNVTRVPVPKQDNRSGPGGSGGGPSPMRGHGAGSPMRGPGGMGSPMRSPGRGGPPMRGPGGHGKRF